MRGLDHPNVVKLCGALECEDYKVVYMIMEYCSRGCFLSETHLKSLKKPSKQPLEYSTTVGQTHRWKLDFKQAKRYTVDLISGLLYSRFRFDVVHNDFNMIHYDIKPDNILVDHDNIAKYTDFGTSIGLDLLKNDETPTRIKGTPIYHPPEVWAKCRYQP